MGRDGAPSFTGDEVIFGTTPSVDAPFDGEDALALYMEGLGLSGDGPQRLALWRSDGKRVFGAIGMQSERFGETRFFGSGGRQPHGPRGARVQEPDELQLGRVDARVQMADGAVGVGVHEHDDYRPHGVNGEWLQHVHWTLPGHGEGFGGQTLRSRAADIVARKLRHCNRMIATVRECPGIGGEELARRSLTQKDEAAWRAAPSISRYYSMLEAFVGARYLENQGKLRREEVDGIWRFYVC